MTRGQSEAFGIAFIVLILILGTIVFLSGRDGSTFDSSGEMERMILERYLDVLLADDVRYEASPILPSCTWRMSRFLRGIYVDGGLSCGEDAVDEVFAKNVLGLSLSRTLDAWGTNYDFLITDSVGDELYRSGPAGACDAIVGRDVVEIASGDLEVSLTICE